MFGEYINVISSWIETLIFMYCLPLLLYQSYFKDYFDRSVTTPAFFYFHLNGVYFSSLYVSLDLKCVSCRECREHTYIFFACLFVFMHSDSLCVFVGNLICLCLK